MDEGDGTLHRVFSSNGQTCEFGDLCSAGKKGALVRRSTGQMF